MTTVSSVPPQMYRSLRASALFVGLTFTSIGYAQADKFAYRLPAEFADFSKDAPAANLAKAPPQLLERARKFEQYGVVIEGDRALAEVTVTVEAGNGSPSDSLSSIVNLVSKQPNFRVLAKDELEIQQVECAKLDFTATVGSEQVEKIAYILPLGPQRALITLEGRSKDIELFRAGFEASVAAVQGLHEPTDAASNTLRIGQFLLLLSCAALVGKALRRSPKRKRRAARAGL